MIQKRRWVNGSVGRIEAVEEDEEGEEVVQIRLQEKGRLISVYPHTWEVFRFSLKDKNIVSESVGTFTQYPFRLAWAVTIHKSQGKTFDHVVIDIGKGAFVSGQVYVALSRCTSFEGIVLRTPIKKSFIYTDYRISQFLTNYQYSIVKLSSEEKQKCIQKAIKNKRLLQLTYLKTNDTKTERVVQPLSLGTEHYKGKAFPGLKAFCTKRGAERLFHLDRILKMEESPRK